MTQPELELMDQTGIQLQTNIKIKIKTVPKDLTNYQTQCKKSNFV